MTATLGTVSPLFITADVRRAAWHYRDNWGFDVALLDPPESPFFAIVRRDEAQIMLKEIGPDVAPHPNHGRHPWARWDAFIYTADPEAIAQDIAARGAERPEAVETDDALLGFTLTDADGYTLFVGRPV